MASLDTNRALTILEVKDHLFKTLKLNAKAFDELSQKDQAFHDQAQSGFDKTAKSTLNFKNMISGAGAALGVALVGGLGASIKKAEEFKTSFRELENLNLDKSPESLKQLEANVLDASFATGRAKDQMTKAFFDIQSGTGKFGDDVELAAKKASDFARAYQVDFNTTIDGAVKGMKNFNIESKDLDQFFASMVKTVQVGIVTFEQLAQVQTDFAGAANTANQSLDSANKLFAVFSAKTKSAEEAATLTKSAFSDLLKPATLEAFDKIGVKVFDKQTGKVRQLDEIVTDLNSKFKQVGDNDQSLNTLVNQFSGSEGLIALIGEAAKNGDEMLRVFQDFDNTEFRMADALRSAKMDSAELAEIARNKLDVVMTRIGQQVLPIWVELLDHVNTEILPGIEKRLPQIEAFMRRMGGALQKTVEQVSGVFNWIGKAYNRLDRFGGINDRIRQGRQRKSLNEMGLDQKVVDKLGNEDVFELSRGLPKIYDQQGNLIVEQTEKLLKELGNNTGAMITSIKETLEKDLREAKIDQLDRRLGGTAPNGDPRTNRGFNPGAIESKIQAILNNNSGGGSSSSSSSGTTVSGTTSGGRNITVTIQRMVGVENYHTTERNDDMSTIGDAIREELMRAVRDSEIEIANS